SSWWFQPLGLDVQAVLDLLPEAMQKAQQVVPETGLEQRATRPLPADEPEGMIFVWPTRTTGLTVLLTQIDGAWSMTGCWPFMTSGKEHDAEIRRVVLGPDRLRAMVEVAIADTVGLTFYDYEFAAKRGLYVKGVDHRLVLSGIAHAFGPADTSPLEIGPDAPGYAALSEWSGAVGDNGKVTVQTTGMAAILPREDIAPNAYEVRGPVVKVRKHLDPMLGQPVWLVCVTVARIGEDDTDVNLDIAVAETVLEGRPLPAEGDDIEALILLQGSIWIPAINSPAPDAAAPHPG
ncbi:MAG: hypothetical protein R3D61_16410, partial [Defluviimonas denitrificans]